MRTQQDEVREIVAREGLILRKGHPELRGAVDRLVRTGQLAPVLPGVYTAAGASRERGTRLQALALRDPDATLVSRSAAQLTFWPGLRGDEVAATVRAPRASAPGFRFERRSIPPELVLERDHLRMTVPALTALDLHDEVGADGIDQALRTRTATLDGMRQSLELTPGRPGNRGRRSLLLDSRDEPWSAAERVCHRLLRDAKITGWTANWALEIEGSLYYLDVAFPSLRLVVEIDGRLHEDDPGVFENDRWRQNALVLQGWTVLRFTWRLLEDRPEQFVETVTEAICSIGDPRWWQSRSPTLEVQRAPRSRVQR